MPTRNNFFRWLFVNFRNEFPYQYSVSRGHFTRTNTLVFGGLYSYLSYSFTAVGHELGIKLSQPRIHINQNEWRCGSTCVSHIVPWWAAWRIIISKVSTTPIIFISKLFVTVKQSIPVHAIVWWFPYRSVRLTWTAHELFEKIKCFHVLCVIWPLTSSEAAPDGQRRRSSTTLWAHSCNLEPATHIDETRTQTCATDQTA